MFPEDDVNFEIEWENKSQMRELFAVTLRHAFN